MPLSPIHETHECPHWQVDSEGHLRPIPTSGDASVLTMASTRKPHYISVSSTILQAALTPTEKLVYIAIKSRQGKGDGWCFATRQTLADDLASSKSSVKRSIKTLFKQGWIEADGRRLRCLDSQIKGVKLTPPSEIVTINTNKKERRTREFSKPSDVQLDEALTAYCNEKAPSINAEAFLEHFRLQVEAKGYQFKNHRAAFQNWIRQEEHRDDSRFRLERLRVQADVPVLAERRKRAAPFPRHRLPDVLAAFPTLTQDDVYAAGEFRGVPQVKVKLECLIALGQVTP